jgi:biopolymer transport protein ExbD
MALIQGSQSKKNLNVELNLLPVFDVLSVCICFLLMTVVWIEIRSLETKQSYGGQSAAETAKEASVWMTVDEAGNLTVVMKPVSGRETKTVVGVKNGSIDFDSAKIAFQQASSQNATSTHILPARTTKYDQVIRLMDLAKQAGIKNIGLSPI